MIKISTMQPISSECCKENSFDNYQLLSNKESIWRILPPAMSTKHCLHKEKAITAMVIDRSRSNCQGKPSTAITNDLDRRVVFLTKVAIGYVVNVDLDCVHCWCLK